MKNIVVVGAGNVGVCAAKSVLSSPDMKLCGFLRRKEKIIEGFENIPVRSDIEEFDEKPDGAIICVPSENVLSIEKEVLKKGINTVDAFDIHSEIYRLKDELEKYAAVEKTSAVIGAGWDPGLDSAIRTLFCAAIPKGDTYTDFGPGMSMGHTAAAKSIFGVKDAVSVTVPKGKGEHKRIVYIKIEDEEMKNKVEHDLLSDKYFEHDETETVFVKDPGDFFDTSHRVMISRLGDTFGKRQKAEFKLEIDNPKLTAELLVSAMRASFLLSPGCYFFNEIPPVCFLPPEENYGLI